MAGAKKRKTGRPPVYSRALANRICKKIADGESLRAICAKANYPSRSTVFNWLASKPEFLDQYARAREMQAEHVFDEMLDISDDARNDWMAKQLAEGTIDVVDHEHISRSKLRIDTRKWVLARMAPKKYGERISQEITGKDGGPIETSGTMDLSKLNDGQLESLAGIIAAAGGRSKGD